MLWAFLWLVAAVIAAVLVFFIMKMLVGDDPAAGLILGGVTFVIVGFLLVAFGPGPAATGGHAPAGAHPAQAHAEHGHAAPLGHEPVARAPLAPDVREPVAPPTGAPEAPQTGAPISERVREAARAAGEAARAAAGETAAPPAALTGAAPVRPQGLGAPVEGVPDDLKKIRGVGPKLEELLHRLGIFHFHQVALWGGPEVAWMDSNLEGFYGRVTRDDWVGQAKLLAAGGETEHSRRVERGEIE
jgi:NADH-quinone oxidoreductase subunit E